MVARIVWYKIVHVGNFILSLLRLYLYIFRTFIYGFRYTWGQGRNLHFFRLTYFSLFIPSLLYEFTQFANFFDGSLLKLLVLSPALNVSVTTDRHWIFWTNFLTLEQKFSGRLLVFFDSLFLWISSHRDTSHNFSDSTELTSNQSETPYTYYSFQLTSIPYIPVRIIRIRIILFNCTNYELWWNIKGNLPSCRTDK